MPGAVLRNTHPKADWMKLINRNRYRWTMFKEKGSEMLPLLNHIWKVSVSVSEWLEYAFYYDCVCSQRGEEVEQGSATGPPNFWDKKDSKIPMNSA